MRGTFLVDTLARRFRGLSVCGRCFAFTARARCLIIREPANFSAQISNGSAQAIGLPSRVADRLTRTAMQQTYGRSAARRADQLTAAGSKARHRSIRRKVRPEGIEGSAGGRSRISNVSAAGATPRQQPGPNQRRNIIGSVAFADRPEIGTLSYGERRNVDEIFNIAVVEHDGKRGAVRNRRDYRPFDPQPIRTCSGSSADSYCVEFRLCSNFRMGDCAQAASKIFA